MRVKTKNEQAEKAKQQTHSFQLILTCSTLITSALNLAHDAHQAHLDYPTRTIRVFICLNYRLDQYVRPGRWR